MPDILPLFIAAARTVWQFLCGIWPAIWQFLHESYGPAALQLVTSYSLKFLLATAVGLGAVLTLRLFDWLRGVRFRDIDHDSAAMRGYMGCRVLAVFLSYALIMAFGCLALAIIVLPGPAQAATFTGKYDLAIMQASKRWMPGVPWKLWKAQLYQESRLDPAARSPAGAEGLAQFMPATWTEVTAAMGLGAVPRSQAAVSIEAGAYYMARLRAGWSSPRPALDRHHLAQASYNGGFGNILAAQRACAENGMLPPGYDAIMRCLPQITGRHAAETLGYAPAIDRWWRLMEAGG
ncbi:transglycosylase SLT domain-containing protein [Ferrovibrio xuzhouensis]|uniref:Transglycosylase SLT domain-containing protein n=1 Tax=Ferrovibrio xuzhouensis TaxID=1576914 RepID=A0ABV7VBZ0_9PROT